MRVNCTKCGRFCSATGDVLFIVYVCTHCDVVIHTEHADPEILAAMNRKALGLKY